MVIYDKCTVIKGHSREKGYIVKKDPDDNFLIA